MPSADTEASLNALYMGLLGLVVVVTQVVREWRDSARARNVARRAEEVKTALIVNNQSTAGKLDEVKTTLARKSEVTAQVRREVGEVRAAIEENTMLTAETKSLVNGQRDALLAEIADLKKKMKDGGIDPDAK